jgi:hypothetical protein
VNQHPSRRGTTVGHDVARYVPGATWSSNIARSCFSTFRNKQWRPARCCCCSKRHAAWRWHWPVQRIVDMASRTGCRCRASSVSKHWRRVLAYPSSRLRLRCRSRCKIGIMQCGVVDTRGATCPATGIDDIALISRNPGCRCCLFSFGGGHGVAQLTDVDSLGSWCSEII